MSAAILPFPKVQPPTASLRISSYVDKDTDLKVWVVDYVDEEGASFTIGMTESIADVSRYVTAWGEAQ